MSQLILQSFCCFTYVTVHFPTILLVLLCHNELCSFSKLSVTSPMLQLILQPFPCFTYVTAHSLTLPSLYLHHSSFSNPVASPMSQFILQLCFWFSYVTGFSLASPGEPPMPRRLFTFPLSFFSLSSVVFIRHSAAWRVDLLFLKPNCSSGRGFSIAVVILVLSSFVSTLNSVDSSAMPRYGVLGSQFPLYTELPKYYVRLQTAVACSLGWPASGASY